MSLRRRRSPHYDFDRSPDHGPAIMPRGSDRSSSFTIARNAKGIAFQLWLRDQRGRYHRAPVSLAVSNQGEPIPLAVLPFIFDSFCRGSLGSQSPSCGLGLGLYISQQIVLAHGGTIDAYLHARRGDRRVHRWTIDRDCESRSQDCKTDRAARVRRTQLFQSLTVDMETIHPFPHRYEVTLICNGPHAQIESEGRTSFVGGAPPEFGGDPNVWSMSDKSAS